MVFIGLFSAAGFKDQCITIITEVSNRERLMINVY